MDQKIKFFNRINIRILVALVALFAAIGLAVSALNYYVLQSIYEQSFTEKVLLSNGLMASLIDPDQVAYYADLLAEQDDGFKQRQKQFNDDRNELWALQESGASEAEQAPVIARLEEFQQLMDGYKGPAYEQTLDRIKKLKEASDSKYVYIFADTGVKDNNGDPLATYIFDAEDGGEYGGVDSDTLGTTSSFEEAALQVYQTKAPMTTVNYYNEAPYGELYYAYAPILDSGGNVVAIVGTDLELGEMKQLITRSLFVTNSIFITMAALGCLFIYLFIRNSVTRPLGALTRTASRLAEGEVYTSVPTAFLESKSELGQLARAIDDTADTYQNMIKSTGGLLNAASIGILEARSDPERFRGDVAQVMRQINSTLDATTLYLNSVPEGLFIMSKELDLFFRNQKYRQLFGEMGTEEFVRSVFATKDDSQEQLCIRLAELLKSESPGITVRVKNSIFSVVFREIAVGSFTENSVLAIAVDITDLVNEKMNAQAANTAKSEFLSRVSHELRTPMNVILGMTTMGLKEDAPPSVHERFLQIDSASRHLLNIINDVLDMSRIESGKLELDTEPFQLPMLLREVEALFLQQAGEKAISLELNIDGSLPVHVAGDAQKLKQVLLNLMSNALKFTEAGGGIFVEAKPLAETDGHAVVFFSVRDTGIGMSPEFVKKIFTPFEQEAVYLQRKQKGTGLGLPICKNLVALMGGDIEVASKQGEGSTFSFTIPLAYASAPADTSSESDLSGVDISGMRVLLVDDLDINRLIFSEMLADQNLQITEAADGAEALKLFEESEPGWFGIVFMDIQMPVMDGYEATRRIRQTGRADSNIPIIAMTANALKQDVDKALESGMDGHVAKPIDYDACVEWMRKFFKTD